MYKKIRGAIENMGFEVNPYDPYVANKTVNRTQMTVTWHVDDLKIPHKNKKEVSTFIIQLSRSYGDKISVNRVKVHDYLGMDLDFSTPRRVRVSMIKYLSKIINTFPK